ncbi:MAG TPA: prepilin-type N-terminal cleavage/methylation domain-containing protein [Bacillota bacterium]|nr:prepilin-type N-terminal cleavage/methylation domain-containing protein [Bacillota bacterium]
MMRRRVSLDESGLTLIELLAVVVILGIISAIAIPITNSVIQESRNRAFLSNAMVMKEAATVYFRESFILSGQETSVNYGQLVQEGYLHPFVDPDTRERMPDDGNGSFVRLERGEGSQFIYSIYMRGTNRHIGTDTAPVQIDELDYEDIVSN